MDVEFKITKKPVNYTKALKILEKRVDKVKEGGQELVWFLEHPITYTAGVRSLNEEILDKSIKIIIVFGFIIEFGIIYHKFNFISM